MLILLALRIEEKCVSRQGHRRGRTTTSRFRHFDWLNLIFNLIAPMLLPCSLLPATHGLQHLLQRDCLLCLCHNVPESHGINTLWKGAGCDSLIALGASILQLSKPRLRTSAVAANFPRLHPTSTQLVVLICYDMPGVFLAHHGAAGEEKLVCLDDTQETVWHLPAIVGDTIALLDGLPARDSYVRLGLHSINSSHCLNC